MKMRLAKMMLLAALPLTGCAQSARSECSPVFSDATIRVMAVELPMQAGYVSIRNPCKGTVSITGVSSPLWKDVTLHSTRIVNGVSKMRALPVLAIAPGGTVRMGPGGTHIMLMEPVRRVVAGGTVELKFNLSDGRSVRVPFALKPI